MNEDRFWGYVDKRGDDECWEWKGGKNKSGYGRFGVGRGYVDYAHRIAYALSSGANPSGLVMHSCDNPGCCNPSHLSVGSHTDNMQDCISRGRFARGPKHSLCKLTDDQVRQIRDECAQGDFTQAQIADKFGVSRSMVSRIWTGDRRSYDVRDTGKSDIAVTQE